MAWVSYQDKKKRKAIFEDTMAFIQENETLKKATEKAIGETRFYGENEELILPENPGKTCRITVSQARSFESAVALSKEYPGKKICVLNFASAARPGGGVEEGAGAQEESLCRASTLFPTICSDKMKSLYYVPNKREKNNLHNDGCIYSPGVIVCKSDVAFPERIPEEDFLTLDVITCAAPNLNEKSVNRYNPDASGVVQITNDALYGIHLKRAKRILSVAALNGASILVLGAFGCGVFRNDPETVARAMTAAAKELGGYFDRIDFAIKKGRGAGNYEAFSRVINTL